jgi:multidrug efflux pump subunit AcrA (membrane-fusion protein)
MEPENEGAVLTVPLGEDGKIGALPEPLQKLFDQRIQEATRRAVEKAKREAGTPPPKDGDGIDPAEIEDLRQRVATYEQDDLTRQKRYDEALAKAQERAAKEREKEQAKYAAELAAKDEAAKKAQARAERQARRQVEATIRAAAVEHGAREESLDELVELLAPRVQLEEQDDDYVSVVLDKDGDPLDGGVPQLVIDYLASKSHHRKGDGGKSAGMNGGGGGTLTSQAAKVAAIKARIAARGHATADDMRELNEATTSS